MYNVSKIKSKKTIIYSRYIVKQINTSTKTSLVPDFQYLNEYIHKIYNGKI